MPINIFCQQDFEVIAQSVMPQVSGGNYFVNLQRSVRKGDMEIIQWC